VGPPFEGALFPRDSRVVADHQRVVGGAREIAEINRIWIETQRQAMQKLPRFPWEQSQEPPD
jgi:putative proteasome-type protease